MDGRYDDRLALDPLGPPPLRDSRWFVPAHGSGNIWSASRREHRVDPLLAAPVPGATRAVPELVPGPAAAGVIGGRACRVTRDSLSRLRGPKRIEGKHDGATERGQVRSKTDVLSMLRRAGIADTAIRALDEELDDPVDPERDGNVFLRHGLTLGGLMDRRGASP